MKAPLTVEMGGRRRRVPPALVEDFEERLADLRSERRAYLEGFPDLDSAIVETSLATPAGRTRSE